MRFNCPRTCPLYERENLCRFMPVLHALGTGRVTSHTVSVKVEYRDPEALGRAVIAMGGQVLGRGTHKLFERPESGYGYQLPGWNFPVVLTATGTLAYDDYRGRWGNVADLERLEAQYAVEAAASAATAQGWYSERRGEELVIFHPEGGTLTVKPDGTVDAAGFVGAGCHDPVTLLSAALGTQTGATTKPEYHQRLQSVSQQ